MKVFYNILLFSIALLFSDINADCKLINKQCLDNQSTKIIGGVSFNLADACSVNKLSGVDCCWNLQEQILCNGSSDTCGVYRQNSNCALLNNTCVEKDYITGNCIKFQSQYSCAGGYIDIESKVCTNVVCADNESGTAKKCFNPKTVSPENTNNMGNAIAYIQMGQSMAQDIQCQNPKDPTTCTLFSGKYFSCYMYAFRADQPGSWNNGGADCMIHHDFFTQAGVPTGYAASDRNLYSHATSGIGNIMGNNQNYSLSNDDPKAINNSVDLHNSSKSIIVNQDQGTIYDPNNSKNSNIVVNNGQVVSVSINKSTIQDLKGFTAFKSYLSDISVNLAWNRQKSEPDPNNIKNITFSDEGITRLSNGNNFGWHDSPNQPVINGLCVHFADFCEGGDDDATASDLIKAELSWAGGFTNPNFCAHCTGRDIFFNQCIMAEPRQTLQQWCCFNSKVALDINLAAYDQGLINIYTGKNKYEDQILHSNNICGGLTVGMITQIDFSKGNYFNDLITSIDINQMIDNSNFTNKSIENNTQNRANVDAINIVNEWKNKRN
jgi:hypothetical protein